MSESRFIAVSEQECRGGVAAALARLEALGTTEEEARGNGQWDWRERDALDELDKWRFLLGGSL